MVMAVGFFGFSKVLIRIDNLCTPSTQSIGDRFKFKFKPFYI